MVACYDISKEDEMNSLLSIIRTVFVIVVLTIGALYFSKDANDLVLTPIEKMVNKVKEIGKNPLRAAEMEEAEAIAKMIIDKQEEDK